MVNSIIKPRLENLDFLISKAELISKIMIFINKINYAITLATCF